MKTLPRQAATPEHRSLTRVNAGLTRPPFSGQHPRRRFLGLAAGAAALPVASRIARAQAYPARPVTMIVPFAAGGAGDVIERVLADRMGKSLRQPFVVENVSGAHTSDSIG